MPDERFHGLGVGVQKEKYHCEKKRPTKNKRFFRRFFELCEERLYQSENFFSLKVPRPP